MDAEPGVAVPPEDPARCHLLGTTALIVQGLMGVFVISSLVIKRQLEKRKRPWRIWLWDVAKQLVGQAMIHALNLLISDQVALAGGSNPCSLYFLNVLIDTTVGVVIFFLSLKAITWICIHRLQYDGFVSGEYGKPPQPRYWWKQLVPYLSSIVIMKLLVLLPLTLPRISTGLLRFTHFLLDYLPESVQVIFVMAVFPLIMNVLQFCIVDQLIKARKPDEREADEEEGEYTRVRTSEEDILLERRNKDEPSTPVFGGSPMATPTGTPLRRKFSQNSRQGDEGDGPDGPASTTSAWLRPGRNTSELSFQSMGSDWSGVEVKRDQRRSGAPSPEPTTRHEGD